MTRKLKKLYLYLDHWRCGNFRIRHVQQRRKNIVSMGLGIGAELCNPRGYMCCLGQWSLQLRPSLRQADIMGLNLPHEIEKVNSMPLFINDDRESTQLALDLSGINDSDYLTVEKKIIAMSMLLIAHDYQLIVI